MMRFFMLALTFSASLLFGGCKKDNNNAQEIRAGAGSTTIIGTWELRQTSAAMVPGPRNYAPGNGTVLQFTDTDYKAYANGQLVKSGQYVVENDTTVQEAICLVFPEGEFTNGIVYDNDFNAEKVFFQLDENKLTVISGCYAYDAGHKEVYERLEDHVK